MQLNRSAWGENSPLFCAHCAPEPNRGLTTLKKNEPRYLGSHEKRGYGRRELAQSSGKFTACFLEIGSGKHSNPSAPLHDGAKDTKRAVIKFIA